MSARGEGGLPVLRGRVRVDGDGGGQPRQADPGGPGRRAELRDDVPEGALAGQVFSDPGAADAPDGPAGEGRSAGAGDLGGGGRRGRAGARGDRRRSGSPGTAPGSWTPKRATRSRKLFKGLLGCNHTDTNSRLCMSSAVAGYTAGLRQRRAAGLLRGPGRGRHLPDPRREHGGEPPGAVQPRPPAAGGRSGEPDRRGRPPADADGRARRPPPRRRPRRRRAAAPLPRALAGGRRARPTPPPSRGRPTAGRPGWSGCAAEDLDDLATRAGVPRAKLNAAAATLFDGRRLMSLYCMGANQSAQGTLQEPRADPPLAAARPAGDARLRPLLAHRPAQRDGRPRGRLPRAPAARLPHGHRFRGP